MPVFYVVFLVKKKAGMWQEEFARYWLDDHTPLTAKAPGVRSYRCYPMTGFPDQAPPFEGVAVLGFDDEAAYKRAMASPEFAAALADAPNFQTADETMAFFAHERVVV